MSGIRYRLIHEITIDNATLEKLCSLIIPLLGTSNCSKVCSERTEHSEFNESSESSENSEDRPNDLDVMIKKSEGKQQDYLSGFERIKSSLFSTMSFERTDVECPESRRREPECECTETRKAEMERHEAGRKEAERREAERRAEMERREAERRAEMERHEAGQKEVERKATRKVTFPSGDDSTIKVTVLGNPERQSAGPGECCCHCDQERSHGAKARAESILEMFNKPGHTQTPSSGREDFKNRIEKALMEKFLSDPNILNSILNLATRFDDESQ